MPSRTRSSTARIRICEMPALMTGLLLHAFALRANFPANQGCFASGRVGDAGRNAQFHFGSRVDFAPYCQLASYECGAFPHARQAKVSLPALSRENRCINALSVIPQPQPEALIVITDFDLDLLCVCVTKSVPECFGSNLIHFVTEDGMQVSRLALNGYTECRAVAA